MKGVAPIKRWSVAHEQIVHLHIGRWTNEALAKHFGLSIVRISQILADPKARAIVDDMVGRLRAKMEENFEDGLLVLATSGMRRIADTINYTEFVLGSPAKMHQDRLSLDLIKLVKGDSGKLEENAPPLNEALSTRLIEALEESNKVVIERTNGNGKQEIQEGDFELVETSEDG